MIVTEIIPLDKKKRKICTDSGYMFPLYLSEIRKLHITEDSEISEHCLEEINDLLFKRVCNRMLFLLGDTDKSSYELKNKLASSGYPSEIIEKAITSLKEYGYVDDVRYARSYIELSVNNKGRSRIDIVNRLSAKGIPRNIIDEVMDEFEFDNTELIERALRKRGYSLSEVALSDYNTKAKLYRYLSGKGFSSADIGKVFSIYSDLQ